MSIINQVQNNINPKSDDSASVFESHEFTLVSDVINTYDTYPLTGSYGGVKGWSWSKTFPQNLNIRSLRIENSIESEISSYEEGSKLENWQGCVLAGIELEKITKEYENLRSRWSPKYKVGEYSLYHKDKRLYSDYSLCSTIIEEEFDEETEDEEGGSLEAIRINEFKGIAKNISIAMYKRDRRFVNFPFYSYEYDPELENPNSFTFEEAEGNLDGSDSSIHTIVSINELKTHRVGGNEDLIDEHPDILSTWEYAGKGLDTRSIIYTEYFPIKEGTLTLAEVNLVNGFVQGNIITWTEVPAFTFENEKEFILDRNNGIITINSMLSNIKYTVKSVEQIDNGYTKVNFYEDLTNVKNIFGKFQLDENQIKYDYFEKFIDGIYVSAAANVVSGSVIKFIPEGANFSNGSDLYLSYEASVRIDYEVVEGEHQLRSDNKIDLKPYKTSASAGLIEINPFEKHVSSVELSINKDRITMGLESVRVDAVVFNSAGARVKEVETFFYCDFGNFNNRSKIYRTQSNQDGESFAYYNWGYNEKDSYVWITGSDDIIINNGTTKLLFDARSVDISTSNLLSMCVFQTLKSDPFYGYGNVYFVERVDHQNLQEDEIILTLDRDIEDIEEYVGNQMMHEENIMQESDLLCPSSTNNHAFGFVKNNTSSIKFIITGIAGKNKIKTKRGFFDDFHGRRVTLYKPNQLVYTPDLIRERGFSFDRLLYKDNGVDDLVPLRPTRFSNPDPEIDETKHSIDFDNVTLPIANENDGYNIVAGYKVFLDKKARIWAKVRDPATGREIRSNTITVTVTLPEFLKSTSGFEVEESGLGGANFLKLEQTGEDNPPILYNPFRNGINIIIDDTEES